MQLVLEDVTIDDDEQDFFIRLEITKGNKVRRSFAIADHDIVEVIKAYRESVLSMSATHEADEYFHRQWNKLTLNWNADKQRRGKAWLQESTIDIAELLRKNPDFCAHHSATQKY